MNQLRFYREKTGVSQSQLAAMVGISQPGINQLESGKSLPSLRTAQKIVKTLNRKGAKCTVDKLFPLTDEVVSAAA